MAMAVEVKVTSVLQKVTGAKVVEGDGDTVSELLSNLDGKYPGFKNQIMQDDRQRLIAGGRFQAGDFHTTDQITLSSNTFQSVQPSTPLLKSLTMDLP